MFLLRAASITSTVQQRHAGQHLGYIVVVQWQRMHAMPTVLTPQQEGQQSQVVQHLGGQVMSQQVHDGGQHVHVGHGMQSHFGGHVMSHQVHDGGQQVHVGQEQVGQPEPMLEQHSGGH
mmetsp:Transcript_24762/g.72449  ORF Transcript_24762/g.72449 Transcript_24762/m.72449 type:complete len:119 (-) Transcript_24762:410-766(-)